MTIVKRIEPDMSYKGPPTEDNPSGWRRVDPETKFYPQEEPTDTARHFSWATKGKTVQIVTVYNGKVNPPRVLEDCPGDLGVPQARTELGWQPVYVDEVAP